jgi:hypothetical protein
MFEAVAAAVQSESAGDIFLCACAVILLGTFILRFVTQRTHAHAVIFSVVITSIQAAATAQSSAVPSGKPIYRSASNTPRPSFHRPSCYSQTVAWPHFLGENQCFL